MGICPYWSDLSKGSRDGVRQRAHVLRDCPSHEPVGVTAGLSGRPRGRRLADPRIGARHVASTCLQADPSSRGAERRGDPGVAGALCVPLDCFVVSLLAMTTCGLKRRELEADFYMQP